MDAIAGGWRAAPGLDDTDPELIEALYRLGEKFGPMGVRRTLDEMYPVVDLKAVYNEYVPAEERKNFIEVLPIEAVIIDGFAINGDQFEMGSLQHDVNMGTVSVKFIGVRKLEIIYKHMLEG